MGYSIPPTSFINCHILIKIEKRSRPTSILIVVSYFWDPYSESEPELDLDWTWSLTLTCFKYFDKLLARITSKKTKFCLFVLNYLKYNEIITAKIVIVMKRLSNIKSKPGNLLPSVLCGAEPGAGMDSYIRDIMVCYRLGSPCLP